MPCCVAISRTKIDTARAQNMIDLHWPFAGSVDCVTRFDETHVWCSQLSTLCPHSDAFARVLSSAERSTAAIPARDSDRLMSSCSKGMLRTILGAYLGKHPKDLDFNFGPYGKPILIGNPELSFNLAHSGEVILIAISGQGNSIGVDLEFRREIEEWRSLAARYFHTEEVAELLTMSPEEGQSAFFDCWTRKEAITKALGMGLSLPLDSFRVTVARRLHAQLLDDSRLPRRGQPWLLSLLELSSSYAATVAVTGARPPRSVRHWQFDPTKSCWQALQADSGLLHSPSFSHMA